MTLINVLYVLAGCIRGVIGCFLVGGVLHANRTKTKGKMISGTVCIIAVIAIGIITKFFGDYEFVRIAAEVVVVTLLATITTHIEYRKCAFVAIMYEIAMGIVTFVIGGGISYLAADIKYLDVSRPEGMIAVGIACILAAGAAIYACKTNSDNKSGSRLDFKVIAFSGVAVLFVLITLSGQERVDIPQDTMYMWIILAAVLMGGILIFNMNKQYEIEKKLAQMNAEQAELIEKEYNEINEAYAMNAKLFHDFHNHIGMIRQLVTSEKYKETIEYLDDLQAPIKEMTDSKWTGDSTIDYLINGKIASATEHKIDMQVQVEYPKNSNLRSADMCAIIGNLIDNAIEAAKQVTDVDKRFARLIIRRINQMLIIKVENSYEAQLVSENGQFKTTKKEGGIHGWGIKSVRAAVDKYEGTVKMEQEDQVFKVVATLSFGDKK